MKNVSVTPGVIVERVGDDLMVIVPGNTDVVSLSGRVADILLDVKAGKTVDSNDPAVHDLITLGVLTAPGMSRRGLITAGAIGAGAGITMMAMPAAAASSSGPGNEDDDEEDDDPITVFGDWRDKGVETINPGRGSHAYSFAFWVGGFSNFGPFDSDFDPEDLEFGPTPNNGVFFEERGVEHVFRVYFGSNEEMDAVDENDWEITFTWEDKSYVMLPI